MFTTRLIQRGTTGKRSGGWKSPRQRSWLILTLLAVLILNLGPAPAARATSIDVPCDVDELIDAILTANSNGEADTLNLAAGCTYILTFAYHEANGPTGLPSITSAIAIQGNEATIERTDLSPAFRIFHVAAWGSLTLNELTVSNGYAAGSGPDDTKRYGGGIYNAGATTLTHSTVSGNLAYKDGGGIYNAGTVTLTHSTVTGNIADWGWGGGIYNMGTLTLTHSTISGNTSSRQNGGGIWNADGASAQLIHSSAIGNSSYRGGGGIYNTSTMALTDSTVSGNYVEEEGHGGGIRNEGTITLTRSTVSGNFVEKEGHGGGIYNKSTMTLTDSTVKSNYSYRDHLHGGGIYNAVTGTMTLTRCALTSNVTFGDYSHGGGVHNEGSLAMDYCLVSGNQAAVSALYGDGGGIHNVGSGGSLTLTHSIVTGNSSNGGGSGGGIWNSDGASAELTNSTISGNTSSGNGGGINNTGSSTLTLNNSTVSDNAANWDGGGVWNDTGSTVQPKNSILAANTAGFLGPDCRNAATLTSGDYNLVGDTSDCPFTPQAHDQTNVDPLLDSLGDNGGPTETHALLFGSPAIDTIPLESCTDTYGTPIAGDQRGVRRPQGLACDIGAYEVEQDIYLPLVMRNAQ
jgi:hypothetical protein